MKVAVALVLDSRAFELAKYSLISAMLHGESNHHYYIFSHNFDISEDDPIFTIARDMGVVLRCPRIRQDREILYNNDFRVTSTSLLKIDAIDILSKDYDKVLYIDPDVLIFDRLQIADLSFDSHPIAAVYDMAEVIGTYDVVGMESKSAGETPHYFNSGVIFVDSKKWSSGLVDQFYRNVIEHGRDCRYRANCTSVDQCAWNMTFDRNWKRLPLDHNFQAFGIYLDGWKQAKVRHYVGKQKFLPIRWHRNDDRDVALINEIHRKFGKKTLFNPLGGILRGLNMIRKIKLTRLADASIRKIDDLLAAPMIH